MNSIKKLLEILPKKTKSKLYIFIILLLISSFFELISISALIPIAEIIITGNTSFEFANDLLVNYENKYTKNQIIITILIFVIILFFLKTLYLILFSYWTNKFSQNIYKTFSEKTLEKYFSENYLFFINNKSSDLIRNIILETKNVSALTFCYLKIVVELFIFFSIGVFILIIDFKTSISLIFFFLFFTIFYYTFTKKLIFNYGLIRQGSTAKLLKNLQEIFGSIKDIKLKRSENFFKNFFSEYLKMFVKAAYKSNTFNEAPRFLIELCFLIILTIIITLNISDTDGINSILPLLVVYSAAGLRLLPGFVKLNSYLQSIESYKPSLNLIYKELKSQNVELNIKHKKYDLNDDFNLGDITFQNINFSFGKKKIFEDLNLIIKKNSILGISGDSGSGKSTLINILLGLLKLDKGKLLIDNLDIEDSLDQWQKSIGYVSQNIFLLDTTLKENIAFGIPLEKINYDELNRVIEYANLTDFVQNLSNGLDTNIGEKGSKISGGQIQRIAIARELYQKPSVLILDEATTGLDKKTEIQIFKSIEKLKSKITIIIVSHNQDTLKVCDEIFDLNELKKKKDNK
jgi:ABC-type multidrug transport system fused ATPase/permease subunit|tara:strand:+ start:2530 stop:4254 length:1725 start_codon:yes stop_codon:yes gene_type:complete